MEQQESKARSPYQKYKKQPYNYSHLFEGEECERVYRVGRMTADTPLGREAWAYTKQHGRLSQAA